MRPGESLEDAAERELVEETSVPAKSLPLEQVHTYSKPGRDPRGPIITTSFLAIAPDLADARGDSDAEFAGWLSVRQVINDFNLAFDHRQIVSDALAKARDKLQYTTIATAFCRSEFTIKELREVYETVWDVKLDAPNFHRKVRETPNFVERTDNEESTNGRPAALYRSGKAEVLSRPILMPSSLRT
ncbi:8-oxo-dGTP diphosphatase [Lentzea fradiae]|uniref:8-oxo-dGTP diphosphatase n=1 Tax=Lentzea fradiae TaxID=200378 RepID=A0A1G8D528_9PSEU|nr:8-oxo-dGTP diphosphatase [Lentzea fradiae]